MGKTNYGKLSPQERAATFRAAKEKAQAESKDLNEQLDRNLASMQAAMTSYESAFAELKRA